MATATKQNRKLDYIPELLYEAPNYPGEKVSPIPYIEIPKDKDMPSGLFVMEYRKTGENEVGDSGKPEEIMDGPYPHMYVDFKHVEAVLVESFPEIDIVSAVDKIRVGLGLKPLAKARKEGNELLDRVVARANDIAATVFEKQNERKTEYENKLKTDVQEGNQV
jgi:hypothetical protein